MAWTDDTIERLRRMWAAGETANAIAKEIGITRNAVLGKARRLGLEERHSSIGTRTELPELKFERVIDIVTDFDASIDTAADAAGLPRDTAREMWTTLADQYGEVA